MKNKALFSSKDKSKKLKCRLLQFLIGALRVNDDGAITQMLDLGWTEAGKLWTMPIPQR